MKSSRIFGLGLTLTLGTVAIGAEPPFSRRDVKLIETKEKPAGAQPANTSDGSSGWRIAREAPLPDRPLMENNPLVTRRCVFYKEQKVVCDDRGFMQVFSSRDESRAIVTSWSDSAPGEMRLIDRAGKTLGRWPTSDHHAFVAKAARKADLVVAEFESGGSSHVIAVDMEAKLRWKHDFKGADGRVIDQDNLQPTDDGRSIVASNGRSTRVLDQDGRAKAVFEGLRPRRLSPKQDWVLLCNGKQAVVHELATGKELFRAPEPERGRSYACQDVSADGQKVVLTENSGPSGGELGKIERIHIVDLKARSISTATKSRPLGRLRFEPDGRVRVESKGKADLLEVSE